MKTCQPNFTPQKQYQFAQKQAKFLQKMEMSPQMMIYVLIFITALLLSAYCVVSSHQHYEAFFTVAWGILQVMCSLVSAVLNIYITVNHPEYLQHEVSLEWVRYLRFFILLTFQAAVMNMLIAFSYFGLIPSLGFEEAKWIRFAANAWPLCGFSWAYAIKNIYKFIRAKVVKYNTLDCQLQAVEQGMTVVSKLDIFEQVNSGKNRDFGVLDIYLKLLID
eukprot:TRINITY_DN834_c0_g1_i1.p1 TRINITY_DN834_c0_g1~~TRINITY_DN834_c0_g1_i1.p1  ORF type:complete len:219 (-),score=9.73 TRINITY_DN834_c0_g1_i1:205-861(-)